MKIVFEEYFKERVAKKLLSAGGKLQRMSVKI